MLWSAFLVAAAMLVCHGPLASGLLFGTTKPPLADHVKSMLDDWLNPKYLLVVLNKELQDFLDLILSILKGDIPRGNVTGIRQECRTLNDSSRVRLFQCFKRLANSGYMVIFEAVHRSIVAPNAHGGACFPSWHHLFLELVEIALQTYCNDSTIFLCYWDVVLDSQMPRPCDSALFTKEYVGNENGPVVTGPYANKQCLPDCYFTNPLDPTLVRQCGASWRLSTDDEIESIVNAISYGALTEMNGGLTMVEDIHGFNHMFIGGQMSIITCSPCDCIFFLFHTFIDMLVITNLDSRNASIDQEYPTDSDVPPAHMANVPIQPFNIRTCVDELRPRPAEDTPYAPRVIQCNSHDDCGGKALWCNGGRCAGCVRGGAPMEVGWPGRACFIQGCANPVNANGVCSCGGGSPPG